MTEVKQPLNLCNLNYTDLRLLSVYLYLKSISNSGRLSKTQIRSVWYWREKLEKRGLIKLDRSGNTYLLRCYASVWRIFGIGKTKSKRTKISRVWCVRIFFKTRAEILNRLREFKSNTLAKQIKYVRSGRKLSNKPIEAPLACSIISKFFGYKTNSTGSKIRRKFFKLIDITQREMVYIPDINPNKLISRFKTKKIFIC